MDNTTNRLQFKNKTCSTLMHSGSRGADSQRYTEYCSLVRQYVKAANLWNKPETFGLIDG